MAYCQLFFAFALLKRLIQSFSRVNPRKQRTLFSLISVRGEGAFLSPRLRFGVYSRPGKVFYPHPSRESRCVKLQKEHYSEMMLFLYALAEAQ